jgi:F-type H+-transporting ATPase subunit c
MRKNLKALAVMFFLALVASIPLLAQESGTSESRASMFRLSIIVGASVIVVAAITGAICQAKALSSTCEGISRNPNAGPHIRFLLVFGLVLIETLVIYALLISIIILMIQWGKY